MICNRCGMTLKDDAVFCHNCGAKVEAAGSGENYLKPPEAKPEPQTEPQPQPVQQYIYNNSYVQEKKHLGIGGWILRYLINFIPCVGPLVFTIMLFVWSFDEKYDDTSRNWAKATLIWMAVIVALFVILGIVGTILAAQEAAEIRENNELAIRFLEELANALREEYVQ